MTADTIIEIKDVCIELGGTRVHKGLNLTVNRGEILGIVGGSGSGKTTLLREMLGLTKPTSGSILLFNEDLIHAPQETLLQIQRRLGVLFQQNALFSSLNLLENVAFPLHEHTDLDQDSIEELALLKILMTGLPEDAALKYPSELSGGMQKRAGLARAIVLDPELIFLDEPSTGLDPATATQLDELILNLQKSMNLTVVMVTHDLDTLWRVTDRVAFLGEGVVLCVDTMEKLATNEHELIQGFFGGERGKVAQAGYSDDSGAH
ncbi:MAG: ABC transporter ATP-binding protein [Gammaproteobacteria bacterium RIFCSPHIGHO2_12_FULL_38_14]|nr:MAG: ABC transporter ATP-binding protein [Gammaproteobacteria bacterium RIFCSPHIGHO2_12_FULL_38_14]